MVAASYSVKKSKRSKVKGSWETRDHLSVEQPFPGLDSQTISGADRNYKRSDEFCLWCEEIEESRKRK